MSKYLCREEVENIIKNKNHTGMWYVYALCRPDKKPFYIGKGKRGRLLCHECSSKNHIKNYIIRKIKKSGEQVLYKIYDWFLDEKLAFKKERELVRKYGRIKNHSGILSNFTEGGEGVSGFRFNKKQLRGLSDSHKGKKLTEEQRKKISIANKGRKFGVVFRKQISVRNRGRKMPDWQKELLRNTHIGKHLTEEHKEKLRQANLGKTLSYEHRKKISESNKGYKHTPEQLEKIRAHAKRVVVRKIISKKRKNWFLKNPEKAQENKDKLNHVRKRKKQFRRFCKKLNKKYSLGFVFPKQNGGSFNYWKETMRKVIDLTR